MWVLPGGGGGTIYIYIYIHTDKGRCFSGSPGGVLVAFRGLSWAWSGGVVHLQNSSSPILGFRV